MTKPLPGQYADRVEELEHKLAIAQAEIQGYVDRHNKDRRRIIELETHLANMAARLHD